MDEQRVLKPEQYQQQLRDIQGRVRRAVLPQRKHLRNDLVAGLTTAIAAVPDGMASAVMAGLNSVQGLYACMIGTPVAATASSSVLMKVNTTSAMALATGAVLVAVPTDQKLAAVVALTILIGLFQIAVGLARLGFLTRYISNAVMTGFMSGVAVLIILGQLGDLTGLSFAVQNRLLQLAELALSLRQIDVAPLFIGVGTIALVLAFEQTRLRNFAMLLALVLASLTVPGLGLASVELVGSSRRYKRCARRVRGRQPGSRARPGRSMKRGQNECNAAAELVLQRASGFLLTAEDAEVRRGFREHCSAECSEH